MSASTTVLVIDDDADFREFVRIVLESHEYRVLEAENAANGLALMRTQHPDAVLLDAMMSYELAGLGIIKTVRQDPTVANTPLILISAVLSDDEDRFLSAGERSMVDRFLTKPISPETLLVEIAAVLSDHTRSDSKEMV